MGSHGLLVVRLGNHSGHWPVKSLMDIEPNDDGLMPWISAAGRGRCVLLSLPLLAEVFT